MTQDEISKTNLDLLNEFMQSAFEFPDLLDQIPPGAELIIPPENDPDLYRANHGTLEDLRRRGKTCVVVHLRKPERIPPTIEVAAERPAGRIIGL